MSVTESCACAVPIVPAASMRATPYVQICIFISIFRKSALRQTDLHDLFERQVAETLVGAALRGDFEFHRPPRRIAGRDRHAEAHEVAKGLALSEKLVLLHLPPRNLDIGEPLSPLPG